MEKILNAAQYLFEEYKKLAGETIDQMKLHKLLYFAQRESFAITGKPLFSEELEGWKYGPVSPKVRAYFTEDGIAAPTEEPSLEGAYILKNILLEYGPIASSDVPQGAVLDKCQKRPGPGRGWERPTLLGGYPERCGEGTALRSHVGHVLR